jgi:integrase
VPLSPDLFAGIKVLLFLARETIGRQLVPICLVPIRFDAALSQFRQYVSQASWENFVSSYGCRMPANLHQTENSKLLNPSMDFVLHSLRHTMLTGLGKSGADAFTIMRIAGHRGVPFRSVIFIPAMSS